VSFIRRLDPKGVFGLHTQLDDLSHVTKSRAAAAQTRVLLHDSYSLPTVETENLRFNSDLILYGVWGDLIEITVADAPRKNQ
jgi:hypothetical protein